MEDFATFCKEEKLNKAIELQNSAKPLNGFIASRFNRDNFWNLIFAVILFIGLASGFIIPQPFGSMMFWLAFITAVVLTKHNSHLTFDKEKLEFTTSQGIKIRKSGIGLIWLILISSFSATLAAGLLTGATDINGSLLRQFLTLLFLAVFPSLYCIIRNFPVSVYFHKNAWYVEGANTYSSNSNHSKHHESLLSTNQLINNPINNWYSGNIFHKK